MPSWPLLPAIALVAVSCGPGSVAEEFRTEASSAVPAPNEEGPPQAVRAALEVEDRPVWPGFEESIEAAESLAAYALGPLEVFEEPGAGTAPQMTLEGETILGTTTVLAVLDSSIAGWLEVILPIRPNGSTGWIRADDVVVYVADSLVIVELEARRLTYLIDDVEVFRSEVGIGSVYNPTPTGHFFVTDRVTLTHPNSPWGPNALGLSARSDVITEYNGGDGIIGIHGTNNPSSIGSNISLGCVRLPNEMITILHDMVPLGTRVEIRA